MQSDLVVLDSAKAFGVQSDYRNRHTRCNARATLGIIMQDIMQGDFVTVRLQCSCRFFTI